MEEKGEREEKKSVRRDIFDGHAIMPSLLIIAGRQSTPPLHRHRFIYSPTESHTNGPPEPLSCFPILSPQCWWLRPIEWIEEKAEQAIDIIKQIPC